MYLFLRFIKVFVDDYSFHFKIIKPLKMTFLVKLKIRFVIEFC